MTDGLGKATREDENSLFIVIPDGHTGATHEDENLYFHNNNVRE